MKAVFRTVNVLIVAGNLLGSGCAHFSRVTKSPPAQSHAVEIIPAGNAIRETPMGAEEYYVGPLVDPDDPSCTYAPGAFRVLSWNPSPLPGGTSFGPISRAGMANDHPEMTATELAATAWRSQQALAALTEENERLTAALAQAHLPMRPIAKERPEPVTQPVIKSSPPAMPVVAQTEAVPSVERFNILTPTRDHVIELDPNLAMKSEPTSNNPFVQLYQPPLAVRDIALTVSAVVLGPQPSVVLNDEPFSMGEKFEDLEVYRIEADKVYLRRDEFLLACPVSPEPVKLRIP